MADIQPTSTTNITRPAPQPALPPELKIDPDKIHLTVRNRTSMLFDEDVFSLTTKNDTGIFDILPEHANFISLINSTLVIGKLDGTKQEIPIVNGVLKVKDSAIHCYIDLLAAEKPAAVPSSVNNQ